VHQDIANVVATDVQAVERIINRERKVDDRPARRAGGVGIGQQNPGPVSEVADALVADNRKPIIKNKGNSQTVGVNERDQSKEQPRSKLVRHTDELGGRGIGHRHGGKQNGPASTGGPGRNQ